MSVLETKSLNRADCDAADVSEPENGILLFSALGQTAACFPYRQYGQGGALGIRQVRMNLAGNALKHAERGEISIEITSGKGVVSDEPDEDNTHTVPLKFSVRAADISIPEGK